MPNSPPHRRTAFALITGLGIGAFIGIMLGLNIARRLLPLPTEPRLTMQLMELEIAAINAQAKAGRCAALSAERSRTLEALADLVPHAMRDTLLVDAAFELEARRLQFLVRRLVTQPLTQNCRARREVLSAIDTVCRDCHDQFRTGR